MRPLLVSVVVLVTSRAALGADYVNDPLTASEFGGRGSQGGSYGDGGWTTTGPTDAVWYEVQDPLPTGAVEFSVTGISPETSLKGTDHDIFAMYQAPSDMGEPAVYSPYFRNNDFKAFTRLFGVEEPGRAGAMKLEFILCPRGEPWHHDFPCTEECGMSGLAYANGTDKDIGWSATTWYRIRIAWGDGKIAFSRDGIELGAVTYPGTYAPSPLRIRLGSPRHGIDGFAVMPTGLTFKDVLVTGEPGAMSPICGQDVEPPDVEEPADAGPPPDVGPPGGTAELAVLADVTAAEWSPNAVFEDPTDLNIEGSDGGVPTSIAYLRFPAPPGLVQSARLRLRTHEFGSAAGGAGRIHGVAPTGWSENSLAWSARPPYDPAGTPGPAMSEPGQDVEWDVTALVQAGFTEFAVVSGDPNGAHYVSKEFGGAPGPLLIVDTVAGTATPEGTDPELAGASSDVVAATDGDPSAEPPPSRAEAGASGDTAPGDGDAAGDGDVGPITLADVGSDTSEPVSGTLIDSESSGGCQSTAARSGLASRALVVSLLLLFALARRGFWGSR